MGGIALIAVGSIMNFPWVVVAGFACFVFLPYLFLRSYRLERTHKALTVTAWGYARLGFAPFIPVLLLCAVTVAVIGASASATGPIIFAYFNVISLFFLLLLFFFPQILALSYGAKRLEDKGVLERISAISQRIGVEPVKAYILPWKSIGVANALEAGSASNKSIFISDYLLELLAPREVDAVIAHELAHAKGRHVLKKMLVVVPLIFVEINLLAYYFIVQDLFAVEVFIGFVVACSLVILLCLLPLSRRYEFEADRMAVDAMGDPEPIASALMRLRSLSTSNEKPSKRRWSTHPTLEMRIKRIMERRKSPEAATGRG